MRIKIDGVVKRLLLDVAHKRRFTKPPRLNISRTQALEYVFRGCAFPSNDIGGVASLFQ